MANILFLKIITYIVTKMEWLSCSEADVWLKLLKYEGRFISMKDIKKAVKTRALIKKLHSICRKSWIIRVRKGTYYIPSFKEIVKGKVKPYRIETLEDAKNLEIPVAMGSPANSEMYWYPVKKPQRIYALKKHTNLIESKFQLMEMSDEMLGKTITIGGYNMLSLEDTIVESLKDNDVQAAMAMAHRQKEAIDWDYLIRRIKEENVELLAYVALDRFPQARIFRHNKLPKLTDTFIMKVLRENKVFAMTRGI